MAALARMTLSARLLAVVALVAMPLCLSGCEEAEDLDSGVARVTIGGKKFILEISAEPAKIARGLMEREVIEEDGGMIFVFPDSRVRQFWMKNCLVDMDILFLDGNGRVLTTHTMEAQPLRGKADNPAETMREYEERIRDTAQYPSRYPAQFVIEIRDGMVEELGVQEGDMVRFDVEGLKALAK